MSCMLVFYLLVVGGPEPLAGDTRTAFLNDVARAERVQAPVPDPDVLYAGREDLVKAREAASIWANRLQSNPRDFEAGRQWYGGDGWHPGGQSGGRDVRMALARND